VVGLVDPCFNRAVKLPEQAARALEAVRGRAQGLRFEIKKACEQERWRLKVCYLPVDPSPGEKSEVQLGLLWSEDLPGLENLRRRLEAGEG
jgi:hypothetical protein